MLNADEIEQRLRILGKVAPRVTKEHLEARIKEVTYTMLPSGNVMVCQITLDNGFSVRGDAACVSRENWDDEIGRKVSYDKAFAEMWKFEGYLLAQNVFESARGPLDDEVKFFAQALGLDEMTSEAGQVYRRGMLARLPAAIKGLASLKVLRLLPK